jgi:hypothetical protein
MKIFPLLIACTATLTNSLPALEVKNGQFVRDGKEYRGIGINYYDAFMRLLPTGAAIPAGRPAYMNGFAYLASQKVPFVRFAACGFFPVQMELYQKNQEAYFELLDGLVKEAKAQGIGLIPSLFWSYFCVPDLVGEPISAWGDPASKTRDFMRRYTREVVERYKESPTIWGWEFGNEFLNEADLPGSQNPKTWVVPKMRTAAVRTNKDKLASEAALDAYREFGEVVRSIDAKRPIFTGDASPRVSSWNIAHGKGWARDTRHEWMDALARANPTDTINLHFYHPRRTGSGYKGYGLDGATLRDTLTAVQEVSKKTGKPTCLGEFGPGIDEMDVSQRRAQVTEFLTLIEELGIPLSAYWVFDSPNPDVAVWSAAAGNENAYVFDLIREANKRLSSPPR